MYLDFDKDYGRLGKVSQKQHLFARPISQNYY